MFLFFANDLDHHHHFQWVVQYVRLDEDVMMIEMIKNHYDEDDGFKLEIGVNILVIVKRGRDADQSQNSLHGNGPHHYTLLEVLNITLGQTKHPLQV